MAVAESKRSMGWINLEYSALVSKELLYAAYQQAVAIPYNFLYIDLLAKNTNNMFFSGFTKKFKMVEDDNT